MSGKPFLIIVALILLVTYSILLSRSGGHHSRAREAAILSEIDQLHSGIQAYKEKHLVYPPCMAEPDVDVRKTKFMRHLRTVYPSSAYGVRVADFDALNAYVGRNYQVRDPQGHVIALDLMNLDAAESLVFWLGGFPTPAAAANQPPNPNRLFGFNKDSDEPLKYSPPAVGIGPAINRTYPRFDFRLERLVDQDGDGWWEYLPTPPSTGTPIAPFVYFDHELYSSKDPLGAVAYPADPQLAEQLGTVGPLAAYLDPAGKAPARWQNPTSFQIHCGGLDGQYSAPDALARISIFPSGSTYVGPNFNGKPGNYDDLELDNLTNLQRQTLGDDRREAEGEYASDRAAGVSIVVLIMIWTVVLSLVVLFVFQAANSRPIGGRRQGDAAPDFSYVDARQSDD